MQRGEFLEAYSITCKQYRMVGNKTDLSNSFIFNWGKTVAG